MPKVTINNITMNYDLQGTGEPLILIPYLAADHACYAFQVPEYAKHFSCISWCAKTRPNGGISQTLAYRRRRRRLSLGNLRSVGRRRMPQPRTG
jgi:hypothetical protein